MVLKVKNRRRFLVCMSLASIGTSVCQIVFVLLLVGIDPKPSGMSLFFSGSSLLLPGKSLFVKGTFLLASGKWLF